MAVVVLADRKEAVAWEVVAGLEVLAAKAEAVVVEEVVAAQVATAAASRVPLPGTSRRDQDWAPLLQVPTTPLCCTSLPPAVFLRSDRCRRMCGMF